MAGGARRNPNSVAPAGLTRRDSRDIGGARADQRNERKLPGDRGALLAVTAWTWAMAIYCDDFTRLLQVCAISWVTRAWAEHRSRPTLVRIANVTRHSPLSL